MKFLIYYSNSFRAKEAGLPLAGTVVEIATLDDLLAFQTKMKASLIIKQPGDEYAGPTWVHYEWDDDEAKEDHHVKVLPEEYRTLQWIEIYNGLRE